MSTNAIDDRMFSDEEIESRIKEAEEKERKEKEQERK